MEKESKWSVDPSHSEIAFKIKHLMIAYVRGTFKKYEGHVRTVGDDFRRAEVEFWIDPSSITTGEPKRDTHLKSADFFDVEKHKEITFRSTSIERSPDGPYELWGDLTIKGITKRIMLTVKFGGIMRDPYGNEKAGFSVTGKIKRKDWQLSWNAPLQEGGKLVGGDVFINCDIELTRKKEETKQMKLRAEESQEIAAEE